jgi:hypothetical protein
MATAKSYEEGDHKFVRETVLPDGWEPPSASSPAPWTWWGIVHAYSYLVPAPEPTTDTTKPSMFAAWRLVYDEVQGDYGGQVPPVRYGRLIVERYLQKGLRGGQLRQLRTALLNQIDTAPDEPLGFDVQQAKTVPVGFKGPWLQENLVIPFCGG